jgi:integrase
MPTTRAKLTAKLLATLQPGDLVRDSSLPGFFATVGPTGAVSLKVQADVRVGGKRRTVKQTLGRFPALTLDAARVEATRVLAEAKAGRDPRGAAAPSAPWTVARLVDEYTADLRVQGKSQRTISDINDRFDRYLAGAWGELAVTAVTRTMARDEHKRITKEHGAVVANDTLRNFRAAFNWARKATDDLAEADNPAEAVTFNPQRARTEVLTFPDLPTWLRKVRALSNPLRAVMHELGLFSGLRPSNLVGLERAWIRRDERAIVIPAGRMKKRVAFALPLSTHMLGLVDRALAAGDVLYRSSQPYLFPTRANKDRSGPVIATAVWKEADLPSETGHLLRHMYSNACNAAGVSSVDRMLLLAQRVPGVEGMYLNDRALFAHLLGEQERVSAWLLAQAGVTPPG